MAASQASYPSGPVVTALRSPLLIAVQIGCYAVIFLYAVFFQLVRGLGAGALALAVGCAILVWLPMARWYVQRLLLWYALVAGIYVFFSATGLLHWNTLLFYRSAILQQSVYAFLLPILVPTFAYYHERVFSADPAFVVLDNIVLVLCVISKLLYAVSLGTVAGLGVVQLFNVEAIFAFSVVRRLYFTRRPSLLVKAAIIIVFVATAGSFQSVLVALFLIAILIAPSLGRLALLCFTFGLIAISLVAVPFADAIWQVDPNTGIRLFFWQDAIGRLVSSYGIGQGFGTETIRPVYELSTVDVTIVGIDQDDFIMVGSHDAFIDAGYRMGIVGAGVLISYIFGLFRKVVKVADERRSFDYFTCAMLFVVLMVNVGLVSINFLFGSSFLIGWLAFRTATGFIGYTDIAQIAGDHPFSRQDGSNERGTTAVA